jgi:protein O-mannosyl-transferase
MSRRAWQLALALLAAATLAAFWPALGNGLVWDDGTNLIANRHLDALDGGLVRWAFSSFLLGHYQPLSWLSLAADRALWGGRPAGYHLTSLLLHLADVLLFAALARRLLAAARREESASVATDLGALVAAAVFALHPLRVESVAWATERRDVLSAAFCLAALLAWLATVDRERAGRPRLAWGAAATALFALSLLSKALALGLPVALVVADLYPLRRWRPGDGRRAAGRLLVEKTPFFALSALFGVIALRAQEAGGALVGVARYGWVERLFQAAYSALFYPRALVALSWSPLYERPTRLDPLAPRFLVPALGCVAVTAALVVWRRRFPAGLAVWAAYLALLAPVSGLAQSGVQLVADRYSYLAALPFALLAGGGVAAGWRALRRPPARAAAAAAVVAVLALWAVLTWRQTRVWHDDEALWRQVATHTPSAMALNNLGALALQRGDRAAALPLLRQAVELAPEFGLPWRNLLALLEGGGAGLDRGELAQTAAALNVALPNHAAAAAAWTTLALADLALDDRDSAGRELHRAVEVNRDYAPAWRRLALLQLAAGDAAGCRDAFAETVRLEPRDADAWSGLGLCRESAGDREGAATAFERALALDPAAATAREHLRALRAAGGAP